MSLSYEKVQKRPTTFNYLFGLKVSQFEEILEKLRPKWQKAVVDGYKRPGRPRELSLEDTVLVLLLYYRSYVTQEFIGYLFGVHKSAICRAIQLLEPILANIMTIGKKKYLSREDLEGVIIDATEQPIERPKKGQKQYYSGKKKRHTLKTEIQIRPNGRIIKVSKSRPGSMHDFELFKEDPRLPPGGEIFVDSGYQGIGKMYRHAEFPYKATKNRPLDADEKEYNQALSRIRVKVENVLGQLKVFRILSDRYRNKRRRYNLKFNIIAGIVNFKNGFATA